MFTRASVSSTLEGGGGGRSALGGKEICLARERCRPWEGGGGLSCQGGRDGLSCEGGPAYLGRPPGRQTLQEDRTPNEAGSPQEGMECILVNMSFERNSLYDIM